MVKNLSLEVASFLNDQLPKSQKNCFEHKTMTTLLHAGLTYLQQNVICSCISARTHHCMPHDLCNFLGKLWKSRQLPRLKQLCFFGLTLVALCLGFTESPVSFPKAPATLGTVWYFLLCSPNSTVPSAPTNTAWRSIWIHRYSDGSVPIFLFLLFSFLCGHAPWAPCHHPFRIPLPSPQHGYWCLTVM